MKNVKAISLDEAYRRYIKRWPRGFYSVGYIDEMPFGEYIDALNNNEKLSIY